MIRVYMKDNEGLPEVEDKSIDLAIADPPFGIDFAVRKASNYNRSHETVQGYHEIYGDYKGWTQSKLLDLKRVLKDKGVIFWWCACVNARNLQSEDRLKTVLDAVDWCDLFRQREIIWGYQFSVWNPNCFTISHQHVLVLTKQPDTRFTWNGRYEEDAVYLKRKYNRGIKTNVTETNEELISWLIRLCSNKDDTILDPFFGSGTTGKVCAELKRHCIAYEKNKKLIPRISMRLPEAQII